MASLPVYFANIGSINRIASLLAALLRLSHCSLGSGHGIFLLDLSCDLHGANATLYYNQTCSPAFCASFTTKSQLAYFQPQLLLWGKPRPLSTKAQRAIRHARRRRQIPAAQLSFSHEHLAMRPASRRRTAPGSFLLCGQRGTRALQQPTAPPSLPAALCMALHATRALPRSDRQLLNRPSSHCGLRSSRQRVKYEQCQRSRLHIH